LQKKMNKYVRCGIIGGIGLLFALTALILINHQINRQIHTEKVIVAKTDIQPFTAITQDQVEYKEMALSAIPADAIRDQKEVNFADLFTTEYGWVKGSPMRKGYTSTQAESKLGTVIGLPKNKKEIGVTTNLTQSAGGSVKAGIYVDVYAWVEDQKQKRVMTPKENPHLTHILVKNIVNAQGKSEAEENNNNTPAVAVLEVTPEQATSLVTYQEQGKVYLLPAGKKE